MISEPLAVGWMPSGWMVPGTCDQVFVDHGNKGGVVFGGEVAEDLIEGWM